MQSESFRHIHRGMWARIIGEKDEKGKLAVIREEDQRISRQVDDMLR